MKLKISTYNEERSVALTLCYNYIVLFQKKIYVLEIIICLSHKKITSKREFFLFLSQKNYLILDSVELIFIFLGTKLLKPFLFE